MAFIHENAAMRCHSVMHSVQIIHGHLCLATPKNRPLVDTLSLASSTRVVLSSRVMLKSPTSLCFIFICLFTLLLDMVQGSLVIVLLHFVFAGQENIAFCLMSPIPM